NIIKLSKEKVNKNRLLAIGPNPFTKNLSIQYESAVNETMQLVFYNSKRQELLRQHHSINKGINQINLRVPQWSSGLYFIHLKTATENIVQKVLKL
ncbi:MAG TPA: T9SS type A sorting domain-containing protein, partial [Ferruginibacter sp.]|nr:T9SS type A sorting domain-containing protein [Ferruginibacter sp.]